MTRIQKSHSNTAALQRIRTVSHLLDNALPIPGTTFRIGIDPILGLLPGAGDWLSALLSVYIVLESLRFKLPKSILMQMVSNLVLDSLAGAVPLLGDLFDVTWKANHRNLALLEGHVQNPTPQRPADRLFTALIVLALILILIAITSLVFFITRTVIGLIQGA
jgi:hypothetical protein